MSDGSSERIQLAARTLWDAIVIGGGPAGAVAARAATLAGLRVLLIDAKHFPREKVCGGYLNQRALAALGQCGLSKIVAECATAQVDRLDLICGHQRAHFPLPCGRIVGRSMFDARLVQSAEAAGATVLHGTQAVVEPHAAGDCRMVDVAHDQTRTPISARVVIVADGLARSSVRQLPEFTSAVAAGSHVGIGAVVADATGLCPLGQITMVVSRDGYVGVSRIDRQRINVAASIAPAVLAHASPAEAVGTFLRASDAPLPGRLMEAAWRGTRPLTSRPQQVASERVFLIGDAGGYVEPFTGEGMAAAVETALAVTPLAHKAASAWSSSLAAQWEAVHRCIVRDRQFTIRQLAWTLRRPWAAAAALCICRIVPSLATRIIATTSRPSIYDLSPSESTV